MIADSHPDDAVRAAMRRLTRYASRLQQRDPEDLAQEAMARATANGVPYDADLWMHVVLRRLATDRVRRDREIAVGDVADLAGLSTASGPLPDEGVLLADQHRQVREALERVPARYREALLVFASEGRVADVTERLELSPQASWTLLSRARARLRRELDRVGFVPAILGLRFRGRAAAVATVGAAAIVVTTIVLPSLRPDSKARPTPPSTVRSAGVPQSMPLASSARVTPAGRAGPQAVFRGTSAPTPSVAPPRYAADACAGGYNIMGVELHYEEDEHSGIEDLTGIPVWDVVISLIPEEFRRQEVTACE